MHARTHLLMQPLETAEHLPHIDADEVLGEGAEVLDEGGEGAVLHVLEHEVQVEAVGDELALDLAGGREEALGQRMRDRRTDGRMERE